MVEVETMLTALRDLISSPPGLRAIAEKIEWPGRGDFLDARTQPVFATLELADGPKDLNYFPDDQTLVGRYKSSGNLAWMTLHGQGHDIGKDCECFIYLKCYMWRL